jgi:ribose 1,5-bisphosphokinase
MTYASKRKTSDASAYLFLLVGNSGSGKDSLIQAVQRQWPIEKPTLKTPRRYITRPAHPSEPYHAISRQRYTDMLRRNCFCLYWNAYGIDYALPRKIDNDLACGFPVLVNVSRHIIPRAREKYRHLKVVFVFVPLAVTEERLRRRGRENSRTKAFKDRLQRAERNPFLASADLTLDNNGSIQTAAGQLRDYILAHTPGGAIQDHKTEQIAQPCRSDSPIELPV